MDRDRSDIVWLHSADLRATLESLPCPTTPLRALAQTRFAFKRVRNGSSNVVLLQELESIADVTQGMSARDLRAICEVAERNWVASIIRGSVPKDSLPPASAYMQSAKARKLSLHGDPAMSSGLSRVMQNYFPT